MLWSAVVISFALMGFSAAFTENDWENAAIEVYSKFTKYLNQRNASSELEQLFSDDSEALWPGLSLVRKEGLMRAINRLSERYPASYLYISFAELLFSSDEVAIVRTVQYNELADGSKTMHNGLDMFVRNENGLKVKLSVFNFA